MIYDSIGDNQSQHIKEMEDPRDMWKSLKSVHTRPDRQKLMDLVKAIISPATLRDKGIEERASTLQNLNRQIARRR